MSINAIANYALVYENLKKVESRCWRRVTYWSMRSFWCMWSVWLWYWQRVACWLKQKLAITNVIIFAVGRLFTYNLLYHNTAVQGVHMIHFNTRSVLLLYVITECDLNKQILKELIHINCWLNKNHYTFDLEKKTMCLKIEKARNWRLTLIKNIL